MNKVKITPSDKILNLEKYIFAELDEWKEAARAQGDDLIDLGIGNPDGPTPQPVVEAAMNAIQDPKSHGYPSFRGKVELQEAIRQWMEKRYGIVLDDDFGIQTLSGAKEGLAHIALAYTNPGDINIVPDPYYPVLSRGTWISSGEVYHLPLTKENNFLPDLDSVPREIAQKAKIIFLNFPNNPTAACAPRWFWEKAVKFCTENNILLVADLAYGEICYDGYKPLSIFSIEGAKEVAVEFHTFSKTFNMAGWRIGFVIGKKEFIDTIYAMKTNIDYGTATIVQDAAIKALTMPYEHIQKTVDKYQDRRDYMVEAIKDLGWDVEKTSATMYLWLKVPSYSKGRKSKEFCKDVMDKTGVVFTPGIAFGKYSDGYFRLSLVQPKQRLKEAVERLKSAGIKYED